ncbi:MAG: SH3 domain-containing protein, partial [Bdellovibrio bacteriovorus]
DGYRFRGRGLIQLTGKNNYQAFSRWIDEDCVANPDWVADRFAAHSAVFFWETNGLNALADTDDLNSITSRVNGGLNGYDDRRSLLVKAKDALSQIPPEAPARRATPAPAVTRPPTPAPGSPFVPTHRVVASALNLRKTPDRGSKRVASLPRGTPVQRLSDTATAGWIQVRARLNGVARDGFVSERYLASLERAESPATPAGAPFNPTHRVSAASLNLRSGPKVNSANRVAVLAQDTRIERLGEAEVEGWVAVRVMLNGVLREGFVAAKYLSPLPRGAESFALGTRPLDLVTLPPAELSAGKREVTRVQDGGRAYPLEESGQPKITGSTPETRARQLLAIIAWLDCENPEHRRYRAKGGATYATTYACDYCHLAGVYLPQVWWTADALARIVQEEQVDVAFGRTVRELSTNALHDWLLDHGAAFGWRREIEPIDLQAAANGGEVCLIIAKSKDLSRPGHLSVVPPEHEGCQARRQRDGDVTRPVESWCATKNVRCATARTAWWLSERYQGFGFWTHPVAEAR